MEELDLKELFMIFWNRITIIILITLIAMAVGVGYSYFYITPEYKSVTKIVLAQSSSAEKNVDGTITQADVNLNSKLVSTYSELIKSKSVLREVVNSLNNNDINEDNLKKNISVQAVKDTEVIQITVRNKDANFAAQIANKIAEVFSEKVVEIYNISNVYILDRAEPNPIPSNINHAKDIVIFGFVGFVISIALVLLLNMLDTSIKNEQDVEDCSGLLVLSSIPNYDVDAKSKKGKGGRR